MPIGGDTSNIIGERGEAIFHSLLTRRVSGKNIPADGYLFQPQFLGEKWPLADYIVELRGITPGVKPFFFVQVKATTQGYTQKRRLKVEVEEEKVRGLAAYPAPTYFVGIDEVKERGFIVSANAESLTSFSSLSTEFPLSISGNRRQLWEEVRDFWQIPTQPKLVSAFVDREWR